MTYQAILQGKIANDALDGAREDVLTASVLGAVAYAPRAVRHAFLSEILHIDLGDPDAVVFSFWPWMRLDSGRGVEPDAWISGPNGAVVVEAKAGSTLFREQLEQEALGARRALGRSGDLYLLTIDDNSRTPDAVGEIDSGLFKAAAHVSWGGLYVFLEGQAGDPSLDPGARQLLRDAIAVLDRFNRRPYRGVPMSELVAIEPGLRALERLTAEVAILHRELAAHLAPYGLFHNDSENKVLMDGNSRSFDRPTQWVPRQILLGYGLASGKRSDTFYFLRVLLRERQVWLGVSFEKGYFANERRNAGFLDALADRCASLGLRMAGVRSTVGLPFELVMEPRAIGEASVETILSAAAASRIELIEVHPFVALTGGMAADELGRGLEAIVTCARGVTGLNAP